MGSSNSHESSSHAGDPQGYLLGLAFNLSFELRLYYVPSSLYHGFLCVYEGQQVH